MDAMGFTLERLIPEGDVVMLTFRTVGTIPVAERDLYDLVLVKASLGDVLVSWVNAPTGHGACHVMGSAPVLDTLTTELWLGCKTRGQANVLTRVLNAFLRSIGGTYV